MNWWAITLKQRYKTKHLYGISAGELRWVFTEHEEDAFMILEHIAHLKREDVLEIEMHYHPSISMVENATEMGDGMYVWLDDDVDNEESEYVPVNLRKLFLDNSCQHLLE